MRSRPGEKEPTVLVKFISAGLAASVAEAATIPIDTAKVRLQVSVFIGQCFLVVDRLKTSVCEGFKTIEGRALKPFETDYSIIAQSAPF